MSICQPQWYLTRPGFSWGGVGVAAIWYGASVGLARTLRAAAENREPDQIAHVHLGAVDTALARARAVLVEAAQVADDPETPSGEAVLVTQRTRQVIADSADEILTRLGHALGPAPLTGDEDHARRVADLTVYLRQHHAERDLARQGEQVLGDLDGLPMQCETLTLWECLASLGAVDLTVARVAEPHLDALAILREARRHGQVLDEDWHARSPDWSAARLWQVYAAEGGERLVATETTDGWTLTGVKPWCSLADRATHALVTAWVDDDRRGLFAVDLAHANVSPSDDASDQSTQWAARGLDQVRSTPISFDAAPSVSICQPQWYLTRPGFSWGGVGVAAIWYGASVGLARTLRAAAENREPDQIAHVHLGAVDTALARARAVLVEAAQVADDPETPSGEAVLVTQRTRQVIADSADEILTRLGHALGPAPLTGDEDHARRVADLTVYLRQHHAERDLARQGEQVLGDLDGWRWW